MADSPQDEVYEVEKILGHKFVKKGKKYDITYYIKWLNYEEEDNTWERESNVFAVDLIIQYWEKLPKNSQDRLLFEQIQSRKKDPILLLSSNAHQGERLEAPFPSAPHTNKTTALFTMKSTDQQPKTTFHATASSSLPAATPAVKKQQNLSDIFRSVSSAVTSAVIGGSKKGKEKQDSNHTKSVAIVKRTPIVVANEEDDLSKTESEDERETGYTESYRSTPAEEDEERDEIIDSEDDEVVTISPKLKRKRTSYSDYFLEQHEKKKRRESQDGNESDSSLTSSIVSDKSTLKGEAAGNDQIIFDEYYSKEPPMDWKTLAVKVEYIGKELPESPLYCTVKWKDGVRSIHPLDLVREKRPDLVIDHFIGLINAKQGNNKK